MRATHRTILSRLSSSALMNGSGARSAQRWGRGAARGRVADCAPAGHSQLKVIRRESRDRPATRLAHSRGLERGESAMRARFGLWRGTAVRMAVATMVSLLAGCGGMNAVDSGASAKISALQK